MANETVRNALATWQAVFHGDTRRRLEAVSFPAYLMKQRWFARKSYQIKSARIVDWTPFQAPHSALAWVEVQLESGPSEVYFVPLGMTFGDDARQLERTTPNAIIAPLEAGQAPGVLHDGTLDDQTCSELLSFIEDARDLQTQHAHIRGIRGKAFQEVRGTAGKALPVRRGSAEQSNTSILYGDRLILKIFRHQQPGLNPDAEIGRYLTERVGFQRIPPFAGSIEYEAESNSANLAILQGLVANEGDGWQWTMSEFSRYFQGSAELPFPQSARSKLADPVETGGRAVSSLARNRLGAYLDSAARLGFVPPNCTWHWLLVRVIRPLRLSL